MRLSEAILLGDSLKKPNGASYDVIDGCGCALAGARLAAGLGSNRNDPIPYADQRFLSMWPWFTRDHEFYISKMYFQVCDSKLTIEQLADEVRKWEDELGVYANNTEAECQTRDTAQVAQPRPEAASQTVLG